MEILNEIIAGVAISFLIGFPVFFGRKIRNFLISVNKSQERIETLMNDLENVKNKYDSLQNLHNMQQKELVKMIAAFREEIHRDVDSKLNQFNERLRDCSADIRDCRDEMRASFEHVNQNILEQSKALMEQNRMIVGILQGRRNDG